MELLLGTIVAEILDSTDHTSVNEPVSQFSNIDFSTEKSHRVAIIYGMYEVQAFEKHDAIETCLDLAREFSCEILRKYKAYGEIHVVFDRYDVVSKISMKHCCHILKQCNRYLITHNCGARLIKVSLIKGTI